MHTIPELDPQNRSFDPIGYYWKGIYQCVTTHDIASLLFYTSRIIASTPTFKSDIPLIPHESAYYES